MRKGQFGPAVIGEEAYRQEQEDVARGIDYFGPGVVGPSEPQKPTPAQLKEQPGLAALHGILAETPKNAGPDAIVTGVTPPPPAAQENVQLSLEKLKESLEDNPYIIDGCIDAELARAEGPRKGALRLLIDAERKKTSPEPRPDVLAKLTAALRPAPAPAPA